MYIEIWHDVVVQSGQSKHLNIMQFNVMQWLHYWTETAFFYPQICSVLPLNWLVLCLRPSRVLYYLRIHTHTHASNSSSCISVTSRRWEWAFCWRLHAGPDCLFTLSPAVVKQCSVKAWKSLMPLSSAAKRKGTNHHPTQPHSSLFLTKPSNKMQCCFSTFHSPICYSYHLQQSITNPQIGF